MAGDAPSPGLEELALSIRDEFSEMPGMRLTFAQVQRLWSLPAHECKAVLDHLLTRGMLQQDRHRRYCRPDA